MVVEQVWQGAVVNVGPRECSRTPGRGMERTGAAAKAFERETQGELESVYSEVIR